MHNHCSSKAKFFGLPSTIAACFLVLVILKIAIWLFSITNINTVSNTLLVLHLFTHLVCEQFYLLYRFIFIVLCIYSIIVFVCRICLCSLYLFFLCSCLCNHIKEISFQQYFQHIPPLLISFAHTLHLFFLELLLRRFFA